MNQVKHAPTRLIVKLAVFGLILAVSPAMAQPGPGGGRGFGGGPGWGGHGGWGQGQCVGCPVCPGGPGGLMGFGAGKGNCPGVQLLLSPQARETLGLNQDQAARIEELSYNTQKELIRLQSEAQQAQLELQRLMQSDNPDRQSVMNQAERLGQLQTEMRKLRLQQRLEIQQILTPEQIQHARDFMQQRRQEFNENRGQGGRGQGFRPRRGMRGGGFGQGWGFGPPDQPGDQPPSDDAQSL